MLGHYQKDLMTAENPVIENDQELLSFIVPKLYEPFLLDMPAKTNNFFKTDGTQSCCLNVSSAAVYCPTYSERDLHVRVT